MISTANILLLLLASGPVKLGLNAGESTMLFANLFWIGPCAEVLDNVGTTNVLLKVNYVYNYVSGGFVPGIGFSPPKEPEWGHGFGLCFELIPHIGTAAATAGNCCIRGCLGVDPYIGLSGNLIRRVAPDSSRCWDLWLLGYTGINIPIGYRDTLTGEPKVLPFELSLFLSAGCRKRFDESQEITPVVMLGLGLNVWLFGWGRKTPHQEVKP